MKITIDNLYETNCYINNGTSISNAFNEVICKNGSSYTHDADQHVFIIAKGYNAGAFMQYRYELVDKLDIKKLSYITASCLFFLALVAGIVIVLITRKCVS